MVSVSATGAQSGWLELARIGSRNGRRRAHVRPEVAIFRRDRARAAAQRRDALRWHNVPSPMRRHRPLHVRFAGCARSSPEPCSARERKSGLRDGRKASVELDLKGTVGRIKGDRVRVVGGDGGNEEGENRKEELHVARGGVMQVGRRQNAAHFFPH